MEAVTPTTSVYANPPDGKLPHKCPGCGAVVEHFLQGALPNVAAEAGDLFVPSEPQVIRETEQVRGGQARPAKAAAMEMPPPMQTGPPAARAVSHPVGGDMLSLDHPRIGGKITVVVCCYGEEFFNLHKRCLNSIAGTVPPSRMDLRVIGNQVGLETINYFKTLPLAKSYIDYKKRRKYTAMREVFYDTETPITTQWIIWFDDDSYVRHPQWLKLLSDTIVQQREEDNVAMLGVKMRHPLKIKPSHDPRIWFQNASWFRGKQFQNKTGAASPNGDSIFFIVGGFWALRTDAMRACEIPDKRLNHNGGDIAISAQLYQGGFKLKQFNTNKKFIHTSAHPRRGWSEKFKWYQ